MSVGLRQFHATLRVLWSEKTTVCRIFSCQRSVWGSAPWPPARSLAGPQKPRSASSLKACRSDSLKQSVNVGLIGSPLYAALATAPTSVCARLVQPQLAHRNSFRRRPPGFGETGTNVRCHFKDLQPHRAGLPSRSRVYAARAGGEYRARTGDLLVANQALSQLS
jgi:hypothetical protein